MHEWVDLITVAVDPETKDGDVGILDDILGAPGSRFKLLLVHGGLDIDELVHI